MLFSKRLYLEAGGFRHHIGMYEDWDIKIRLARDAVCWKYSGITGLVHRHHGSGLSNQDPLTHLRWMLAVIYENREWLETRYGQRILYNAIAQRVNRLQGL